MPLHDIHCPRCSGPAQRATGLWRFLCFRPTCIAPGDHQTPLVFCACGSEDTSKAHYQSCETAQAMYVQAKMMADGSPEIVFNPGADTGMYLDGAGNLRFAARGQTEP